MKSVSYQPPPASLNDGAVSWRRSVAWAQAGQSVVRPHVPNATLYRDPVRVLDDFSTGLRDNLAHHGNKVEVVEGSLTDPQAVARMKKHMNYAYVTEVKPGPAFAGVDVPTKLMAYDYLIVVGNHVKDDTAYKIAKAVYENKPKLIESLGAFRGFNPDLMNRAMPAAFHAGSMKFYKEKGIAKQ